MKQTVSDRTSGIVIIFNDMKKGQIIINAVLIAALAVLYVLHFTGSESRQTASSKTFIGDTSGTAVNIAYINTDSVIAKYEKAIDINADIESKYKTAQAELASKEEKLVQQVQQLQYDMQRRLITRSDAAKKQEELAKEEQELYQRSNIMSNELSEEQSVAFRRIYEDIVSYIEEYNNDKNLTYVLGNQYGGGILYANDAYDITDDILIGLNKAYQEEK